MWTEILPLFTFFSLKAWVLRDPDEMAAVFHVSGITAGERWPGDLRAETGPDTTAGSALLLHFCCGDTMTCVVSKHFIHSMGMRSSSGTTQHWTCGSRMLLLQQKCMVS